MVVLVRSLLDPRLFIKHHNETTSDPFQAWLAFNIMLSNAWIFLHT